MVEQEITLDMVDDRYGSFLSVNRPWPDDPFEVVDVRDQLVDIKNAFKLWEKDFCKSIEQFFEMLVHLRNNGVGVTFKVGRINNFSGGRMDATNMTLVLLAMLAGDIKLSFRTEYEQNQCTGWIIESLMECMKDTPNWWERFCSMDIRPYLSNSNNAIYRNAAMIAAYCTQREGVTDPIGEEEQMHEQYLRAISNAFHSDSGDAK